MISGTVNLDLLWLLTFDLCDFDDHLFNFLIILLIIFKNLFILFLMHKYIWHDFKIHI